MASPVGDQPRREQGAARAELRGLPQPREDRVVAGAEPVAAGVRHPVARAHRAQDLDVLARVEAGDLVELGALGGPHLGARQRGEAVGLHQPPREPEPLHAQRMLRPVVELAPLVGIDDRGGHGVRIRCGSLARYHFCIRSARLRLRLAEPLPPAAGLAAGLLDEAEVGEDDPLVDRLHHVVDGEAGDRRRGQRLHLHAGLVHRAHARVHRDRGAARVERELHVHAGDAQRDGRGGSGRACAWPP